MTKCLIYKEEIIKPIMKQLETMMAILRFFAYISNLLYLFFHKMINCLKQSLVSSFSCKFLTYYYLEYQSLIVYEYLHLFHTIGLIWAIKSIQNSLLILSRGCYHINEGRHFCLISIQILHSIRSWLIFSLVMLIPLPFPKYFRLEQPNNLASYTMFASWLI